MVSSTKATNNVDSISNNRYTLTYFNGSRVDDNRNKYKYDDYGKLLSTGNTHNNPFRYSGEYFDEETGFYYLRARYYNPNLRRFITEDTYKGEITNPLSLNLYAYCAGNPIMYSDPSGNAYIMKRALDTKYGEELYSNSYLDFLTLFNLGIYHEQIIYDNGTNSGLFRDDDQVKPDKVVNAKYEHTDYKYYDDDLLREAELIVKSYRPPYKLLGKNQYNCQNYIADVKKEYRKLINKPTLWEKLKRVFYGENNTNTSSKKKKEGSRKKKKKKDSNKTNTESSGESFQGYNGKGGQVNGVVTPMIPMNIINIEN